MQEASTPLVVRLKKGSHGTIGIGNQDYLVSAKGRAKGKKENLEGKREILGEGQKEIKHC